MSGVFRPIIAVALADLRQRSRSRKLLVIPVLVAYFVKLVTVDSTLVVADNYTGELTIAWFAGMTTVIGTTVFFLFGFNFVKGNITRDRETGVDTLIAPSPISNWQYLLGKWFSNVAILTVATGVLLISTGVVFLLQGTGSFKIWVFISPFLLITLPTMAVVAAAAVCFEVTSLFRGTAGTVVYFALALIAFTAGIAPDTPVDFTGLSIVRDSMAQSITSQYPSFDGSSIGFAYTDDPKSVRTFSWEGVSWLGKPLVRRLPVLAVAVALIGIATVNFNRFDDSKNGLFWTTDTENTTEGTDSETCQIGEIKPLSNSSSVGVDLPSVSRDGFATGRVILTELRMALRGFPRWWYGVCVLALGATALAPTTTVRALVVPIVLLLPLSTWSSLGTRERVHRTEELVFVGSNPVQLLGATYISGVLIGVLLTFPAAIRFSVAGLGGALFGWAVGVLFLPAFALAVGVWTKRPKTFEITYLVAWYLGPVNGLQYLDYLAVREATASAGISSGYLALTIVFLAVAAFGRLQN